MRGEWDEVNRTKPRKVVRWWKEEENRAEERINSYLYVAAAFCWQSVSKDLLPCPFSRCQIVIEPQWESKKASTLWLWHPLALCLAVNNRHISSSKKQKSDIWESPEPNTVGSASLNWMAARDLMWGHCVLSYLWSIWLTATGCEPLLWNIRMDKLTVRFTDMMPL